MFFATAMIHSLRDVRRVSIVHEDGPNDVIAEYEGIKYTAIFNPFTGLYYIDNIYGRISPQE